MPTAKPPTGTEDDTGNYYGTNVLFPKSRAGNNAKSRPIPQVAAVLEAYALETISESDPEFARYLLRFLREFIEARNRGTLPPPPLLVEQVPATAENAEPDAQPAFRVPPFAQRLSQDIAEEPAAQAEGAHTAVA